MKATDSNSLKLILLAVSFSLSNAHAKTGTENEYRASAHRAIRKCLRGLADKQFTALNFKNYKFKPAPSDNSNAPFKKIATISNRLWCRSLEDIETRTFDRELNEIPIRCEAFILDNYLDVLPSDSDATLRVKAAFEVTDADALLEQDKVNDAGMYAEIQIKRAYTGGETPDHYELVEKVECDLLKPEKMFKEKKALISVLRGGRELEYAPISSLKSASIPKIVHFGQFFEKNSWTPVDPSVGSEKDQAALGFYILNSADKIAVNHWNVPFTEAKEKRTWVIPYLHGKLLKARLGK